MLISVKIAATERGRNPVVYLKLVKITKQSLNSTEPKIAALGHPKPFESQNTSKSKNQHLNNPSPLNQKHPKHVTSSTTK
jgi:hypothetical protein